MKYLIDTNILLWFFYDDEKLPSLFKTLIEDESNQIFISIASIWEISIKNSIGKLELGKSFDEIFPSYLDIYSFDVLPVKIEHLQKLNNLPFHHNDPFDRIIISQVFSEKLDFLFTDEIFKKYYSDF